MLCDPARHYGSGLDRLTPAHGCSSAYCNTAANRLAERCQPVGGFRKCCFDFLFAEWERCVPARRRDKAFSQFFLEKIALSAQDAPPARREAFKKS
ncbi:hypothetical protein D3Z48_09165 [Clostridiaceae bacterium]|nr:hypothetical protein [Clostridiaceae bacterium]